MIDINFALIWAIGIGIGVGISAPVIIGIVDLALASSSNDEDEEEQEQAKEEEEEQPEEQTEEQPLFEPDTGSGTITPLNETTSLYENIEYGFNFTFPSAMFELGDIAGVTDLWGRQDTSIVLLQPPENSQMFQPTFAVDVNPLQSGYLDTQTMQVQNHTLKDYAAGELLEIVGPGPVGSFASTTTEHQLIGSQMVDDENKWRVEYLTNVVGIQESYNIVVLIMNEDAGKLYRLHYEMDPLKAPEQMPIANQTIDSFTFLE